MIEPIIDQLKQIIVDELDVNLTKEDIDAEVSLFEEGLGLDSVTIVEFITLIEERLEVQFSEDELTMEPFQNLTTLAQCLAAKLDMQAEEMAGV